MFARSVGSAVCVAVFGALINAVAGDRPTPAELAKRAPGVLGDPGADRGDGLPELAMPRRGHPAVLIREAAQRPAISRRSPRIRSS